MRRVNGGDIRPLLGIAAGVAVLLFPLSACGATEPETKISEPKESSQNNGSDTGGDDAGSTSTPDDTPAPDMPPLPPAAEEKSDDGAAAFAEYYIDLWQRSEKADHFDELAQFHSPDCDSTCDSMEGPAVGHYEEGGDWVILDSVAKQTENDRWNASVTFTIKAGTWVYHTPDAKPERQALQDLIASLELRQQEGKWQVMSIGFS